MSVYEVTELRRQLAWARKWHRVLEVIDEERALANTDVLPVGVMFSTGDSLTWMRIHGSEYSCPELERRVRYQTILVAHAGSAQVKVSDGELRAVVPYDDLEDREIVAGVVQDTELRGGQVLIVPRGHGASYTLSADFQGIVMRLSVEPSGIIEGDGQ